MPSVYKIAKTQEDIDKIIMGCKATGYASIDFETSGKMYYEGGYPTILGVSFQPGSSWIIPLGHFDSIFKKKYKRVFKYFSKHVLEDDKIIKIAWNAKFEYGWVKALDGYIAGRYFDGMLAKYLLNEERPNDLKSQVRKHFPEFANYEENYEGSKLPWDQKPLEGLSQYCGLDCDLTLRLMLFYEKKLIDNGFYSLFRNMMMMGTRVLGDSEYSGMRVDQPYLESLMVKYENLLQESETKLYTNKYVKRYYKDLVESRIDKVISKIEDEIKELKKEKKAAKKEGDDVVYNRKVKAIATREDNIDRLSAHDFKDTKAEQKLLEQVNFNSPAQMGELFFTSEKGFGFKIVKYTKDSKTKKDTTNPSTDEEVLNILTKKDKSGFCQELLNYRKLSTLYGTFVKGMYERLGPDSKVHGRFLLHGTVTGRLSSQDPNLQNIPRDTTSSDIKTMFIPPKGMLLLQLDYSQAELRVMAAMAGETTMIRWFKEGKDIHLASALKKHKMEDQYDRISALLDSEDGSEEYITWKKRRKQAKTINFGIIYGQGANMLAGGLECSVEEAKVFLKEFDKTFPKVAKFVKKQHKFAHENAYVKNVFGRKRRLWDIDSDEQYKVATAERQSVNAPIQGAASDYALFSSILIWEQSKLGKIPIACPQVYTVHDSLGYYVWPEDVHEVVPKLLEICNNPETKDWFGFQIDDVTMKVDFEVTAENWGALKTYREEIDYTKLV